MLPFSNYDVCAHDVYRLIMIVAYDDRCIMRFVSLAIPHNDICCIMRFVGYDICHLTVLRLLLMTFVAYDICHLITFVADDVCPIITFVALLSLSLMHDVCRIMRFVFYDILLHYDIFRQLYDICRL